MSSVVAYQPARRRRTPRLTAALALFALSAALFCALAGYALLRDADERQEVERRAALIGAIDDLRVTGADVSDLDPAAIRALERTAGLKDLRFERDPDAGAREVQSVLDRQGRIVGWFSWQPDGAMTAAIAELRPLLATAGLGLVLFAGLALWQLRRAMRELAGSEQRGWELAHADTLTGLPNHRKLIALTDEAMAARAPAEFVTLAFLDLDGLDDINDALGHEAGDRLLVEWVARLNRVLPPRAIAGRFDGDRFAVLMTASAPGQAETALRLISNELTRPFWTD
ncbi:MAG TPA: diguanylate cyclase, partial [Candidatus Limnocylindrales bacterium]